MGILADIFVATEDEALAYESSIDSDDIEKYERVEFKGLTGLEFGTLWAILENEEWDVDVHMLEDVSYGDDGETWLMMFPDELISLLCSVENNNFESVLDQWAITEELQMSGWEPAEVGTVLKDLIRLAKTAQSSKRGLYLWGSL
jgi:hypothetical protein